MSLLRSSFVICTKDRPEDLHRCLASIVGQTVLPHEVIVVDASAGEQNGRPASLVETTGIRYVHVRSEPGLPTQRNLGVAHASGDVIFFFDDDVVLDPAYHEAVLTLYQQKAAEPVGGVSGLVVNRHRHSRAAVLFRSLFLLNRGVDDGQGRMIASGNFAWLLQPHEVTRVEALTGNNMSYPRRIFEEFQFDENLDGYAVKEDADFSYRVSRKYRLYQTPHARLAHRRSEVARGSAAAISRMRVVNSYYVFAKNIPQTWPNRLLFAWSLCGRLVYAAYLVVAERDSGYLTGTVVGIWRLFRIDRTPKARRSST